MDKYDIRSARRAGGKKFSVWRVRSLLKNLVLLSVLSNALYMVSRVWTTISAWRQTTVSSLMVLLIEVGLSLPHILACLHQADMCSRFTGWRESLRLVGPQVPSVDVFITYCGEGLSILMDTVHATSKIDYPSDRLHIYVLDDCGLDGVEEALKSMQKTFANLYYEQRGKKVTTHSKAANLNFGIAQSSQKSNSDFMAVLDVDMIPEPCWLRAMLPHILKDRTVAMSNPPQDFYNVPKNDILGVSSELRWLSDVMMPMQDCAGKAWCTGSGFVVRRQAIADIGGYPTESLQEDVLTSTLLSGFSWNTVHVHEVLQWGLSPTGLAGILKQRARLAAGIVSIAMSSKNHEKIAPKQRADSVAIAVIYSFAAFVIGIASIIVPILMAAGSQFVHFHSATQFDVCFWLGIIDCGCQLAFGLVEVGLSEYRLPILNRYKGMWSVPHRVVAVFETLARGGETFYKPTGLSLADETDFHKWPLWRRAKYVLVDCHMMGHLLAFMACLAGFWTAVQGIRTDNLLDQAMWTPLITGIGWPPLFLFWTSVVANAWVPLAYIAFPPEPAPRTQLIGKRLADDAPTPTQWAKRNDQRPVSQWQAAIVAAWTVSAGALFCIVRGR